MSLLKQSPIVIVGDVTCNQAKIFVSYKGKCVDEVRILGNYDVVRKKLIIDEGVRYSAILLTVSGLAKDKPYSLDIKIDNDIRTVKFKTPNDTQEDITFLTGSCNLHSLGLINSSEKTFQTLNNIRDKTKANFMFHLGDQIYSDIPNPWFSPSKNFYIAKYFDAWSDCESANKFLMNISNYMTLDDHEIINNYRNRSDREKYISGLEVYKIFQRSHAPNPESPHYTFTKNSYPFFVMDVRTTRINSESMMICKEQEEDLYKWLDDNKSFAGFKFIASAVPFLPDMKNAEGDKWCSGKYRGQRNRIVKHIVENKIQNVVFLSGDVHCSLVTRGIFQQGSGADLVTMHEITSSPLNQIQKESINNFTKTHKIEDGDSIGYITTNNYYDKHSNVAVVKVKPDHIRYEFYRTTTEDKVLTGTISLRTQ